MSLPAQETHNIRITYKIHLMILLVYIGLMLHIQQQDPSKRKTKSVRHSERFASLLF